MKYFVKLTPLLVFALIVQACSSIKVPDIDPNQKPASLAVKDFTFPKFDTLTMKNGLKVYVIEDNEQPTIAFRLQVLAGTSQDGDKLGTAELTSAVITKGAGERDALELAQTLDGIGANISSNANGETFIVFASGLKKHMNTILDVYADVVLRPQFEQTEFDKAVKQMKAGLRGQKANPTQVGQAMARKVAYGENHPYARRSTEESVGDIALDDIKNFHQSFFKPNNASIAIVGAISVEEAVAALEKAFGEWQSGGIVKDDYPEAKEMPGGAYFVERPTSVQSTVMLSNLGVPYTHPDYEALRVASSIMGLGFGGRLFRTLRETYSYTYSPFGFLTQAKVANRFVCGADVRNEVTDSTVFVMKRELTDLAQNGPKVDELNRTQRFLTGSFLMSFENTQFVASQLQNGEHMGVSADYVKGFPSRINAVTPQQVQQMAAKYLNPDDMTLVVVGAPSMAAKLEQFGPVHSYDIDLKPKGEMQDANLTWPEIVRRHVKALGGKEAVAAISTVEATSDVLFSYPGAPEPMKGTAHVKRSAPNQSWTKVAIPPMGVAESWTDGSRAWEAENNGQPKESEGTDFDNAMFDAQIFPLPVLEDIGFKVEIVGIKDGNIVVDATGSSGVARKLYIDKDSYMLNKLEFPEMGPQGTIMITVEYSNYVRTDGVLMAANMRQTFGPMTMDYATSYKVNVPLENEGFRPVSVSE